MNDALRMQVSAFVDGELPENESELLLRRLSQDAELRQLVDEYMRIGRLARRDVTVPNMARLRIGIFESLGEEPLNQPVPETARPHRFLKPVAGFAVAASVALVAIFALQQVGEPQGDAPGEGAQVAGSALQNAPASDRILDEMFRHHEQSLIGEGGGPVFGELATYDIEFDDNDLTRVEPKAELVSPVEFSTEVGTEDQDDTDAESETR